MGGKHQQQIGRIVCPQVSLQKQQFGSMHKKQRCREERDLWVIWAQNLPGEPRNAVKQQQAQQHISEAVERDFRKESISYIDEQGNQ